MPTSVEDRSDARFQWFAIALTVATTLAVVCLAEPLGASEPDQTAGDGSESVVGTEEDYPGFSGAFTGVSARGALPMSYLKGGSSSWAMDVGLRHSFPAYVADIRAAYHHHRHFPQRGNAVYRHGLSLHGAFHPGFYFLAGSDWFPYVLASIYIDVGIETAFYTGDADGVEILPSLSAGVDLPIGDPDEAPVPWLHFSWRRYLISTLPSESIPAPYSSIQFGIEWRFNKTFL